MKRAVHLQPTQKHLEELIAMIEEKGALEIVFKSKIPFLATSTNPGDGTIKAMSIGDDAVTGFGQHRYQQLMDAIKRGVVHSLTEYKESIITQEDFLEVLYTHGDEDSKRKLRRDLCQYIVSTFDTMMDAERYDDIADFILAYDFTKVVDSGVPLYLFTSSNGISPLFRAIPVEDKLHKLNVARCKFYDRCLEYYKGIKHELYDHMKKQDKPKDYDQLVKEYDMLYIGGAPKEKKK